jgi:hypothetical protein
MDEWNTLRQGEVLQSYEYTSYTHHHRMYLNYILIILSQLLSQESCP